MTRAKVTKNNGSATLLLICLAVIFFLMQACHSSVPCPVYASNTQPLAVEEVEEIKHD